MYQLFVGEIGYNRHEYLFELDYCDILLISRGYFRRTREMWSATRWQTFYLMSVSMADLKKAGIYRPSDLIKFPWEKDELEGNMPSQADIEEMRRMMREENAKSSVTK
jgi:hypothetical protein